MKEIRCWKFGKWSWHFKECIWCGTSKKTWNTRHKGNGLCINCFDKKRNRNPKRKLAKNLSSKKFREYQLKNNPNFRKEESQKAFQWQHTSEAYKKYRAYRGKLITNFNYFLRKQHKFDKRHNGIEILIDGQRVKTPIKPPRNTELDKERIIIESEIFRNIYRKHIKNRTQIKNKVN